LLGEKAYVSTGPEGISSIASDIESLGSAFDTFYDGVSSSERELKAKILRFGNENMLPTDLNIEPNPLNSCSDGLHLRRARSNSLES
jgi:hypothetical protein